MKKYLYYIMSFIVMVIIEITLEYLSRNDLIDIPFSLFVCVCILMCVVAGNITPANTKFDYIITILAPLSLFCVAFIWSFVTKDDLESKFNISQAIKDATGYNLLYLYIAMAISAFVSSYKSIRIRNLIKSN